MSGSPSKKRLKFVVPKAVSQFNIGEYRQLLLRVCLKQNPVAGELNKLDRLKNRNLTTALKTPIYEGKTPLALTVSRGHVELAKKLLFLSREPLTISPYPLFVAILQGREEMVRLLLRRDATSLRNMQWISTQLRLVDARGYNALALAVSKRNYTMCDVILRQYPACNLQIQTQPVQNACLTVAMRTDDSECIAYVLDKMGTDIPVIERADETFLSFAAALSSASTVRMTLGHFQDFGAVQIQRALIRAVNSNREDSFLALMRETAANSDMRRFWSRWAFFTPGQYRSWRSSPMTPHVTFLMQVFRRPIICKAIERDMGHVVRRLLQYADRRLNREWVDVAYSPYVNGLPYNRARQLLDQTLLMRGLFSDITRPVYAVFTRIRQKWNAIEQKMQIIVTQRRRGPTPRYCDIYSTWFRAHARLGVGNSPLFKRAFLLWLWKQYCRDLGIKIVAPAWDVDLAATFMHICMNKGGARDGIASLRLGEKTTLIF